MLCIGEGASASCIMLESDADEIDLGKESRCCQAESAAYLVRTLFVDALRTPLVGTVAGILVLFVPAAKSYNLCESAVAGLACAFLRLAAVFGACSENDVLC